MSNLKQKHKDYLINNEIKDLTDLVNYVEILRNTSNLKGEDRQMLFDFAFLITNEQLSLKSFFAENKNPSKEFFNAFKKFAENEDRYERVRGNFYRRLGDDTLGIVVAEFDSLENAKMFFKNSPTLIEAFYNTCATNELIEKEEKSKNSPTFMDEVLDSNTTVTEVPNFDSIILGERPKRGKIIAYNNLTSCKDIDKVIEDSFKNTIKVLTGEANSGDTFKMGEKETAGKLNYELDWEFIQQLAERMSQNKGKYKPYNWMQPIDVEKLKQSLFRHVVEVMKGNYEDDGRAFGHLESISANVMMINYQLKNSVK